jgi:hypothetical protein
MKRYLFVLGLVGIAVSIIFCGCTEQQTYNPLKGEIDPNLVGSWLFSKSGIEITWDIYSNGTFSYNGLNGEWATKNGKLLITYPEIPDIISFDYALLEYGTVLSTLDEFGAHMNYSRI